jgi:hypothetical protein
MKMNKILLCVLVMGVVFSGCKKEFFNINKNPNLPTSESITPNLILPRALHETGRIITQDYDHLARWTGQWSRGGDYGPNVVEETYEITTSFAQGNWSAWYGVLNDYNVMQEKAKAANNKLYEAISRTMKTVGFMYLVDSYNNVPYSEAFQLSTYITPKYDRGEDIYKSLLSELDSAIANVNEAVIGGDPKISSADIMFGGDAKMWKKFINTQRLRLVLRLSQTSLINHSQELQKVTSEGFLKAGESAMVNPGYEKAVDKQNPFWDVYKLTPLDAILDKFNRANNFALGLLKSNGDIRYQYYYEEARTPVQGNIYYGYNFGENLPNSDPYKSDNSSAVAGPGLAKSPSQDQWILTSIESMFMQAEAIQRGYISGNAQTMFFDAIRESFNWLEVENAVATADAYIGSNNSFVDWAGASNKIKLIIEQKYFSTIGMVPFEVWTDYRRTGFPVFPLSLASNRGPNIPVRYRYPKIEYDYNSTNAKGENDPSQYNSYVFWDK